LTSISLDSKKNDTSLSVKSEGSDDYLTPSVKTFKENTTETQSSEGYDDTMAKSSETCI
jgi:hypothetical protein